MTLIVSAIKIFPLHYLYSIKQRYISLFINLNFFSNCWFLETYPKFLNLFFRCLLHFPWYLSGNGIFMQNDWNRKCVWLYMSIYIHFLFNWWIILFGFSHLLLVLPVKAAKKFGHLKKSILKNILSIQVAGTCTAQWIIIHNNHFHSLHE